MPLQYIIDAYNIIHHTRFIPHINKEIKNPRAALLEFINLNRLAKSSQNKITVIFDGYPHAKEAIKDYANIEIVFSRDKTADARIKSMVEASVTPKNITVVSDDKEVKFFVRALGSKVMAVEEFIGDKKDSSAALKKKELLKPGLSYSQIQKINEELKKIWLK